ncbi:MAG: amino acid ABC transporter permease [Clostridia bacterium]|nr:amino acid ABC transporter permease [Clostridia bacterium]
MDFSVVNQMLLEGRAGQAGGFLHNVELFAITLLFALPLGLIIAFGSMSRFRPIKFFTKSMVWIIRGTPLMLQLFIVMYGPGLLFEKPIFVGTDGRMQAAAIAFVINYACYFSEIYRGGIESIPKGQYEAGQVLGMTKTQTFFKVILLQVVKNIIAPMSNEFMTLIKDTSLARVIAVVDIIMIAESFSAKGIIWPLFYTGVYFLVFCGALTIIFNKIEKKLSYFKS